MARGGPRKPGPGKRQGRPPKPKVPVVPKDKGFAARVLGRIGELQLKGPNNKAIESAEDYALDILSGRGDLGKSFFSNLLDREYGRPATVDSTIVQFDPDKPFRVVVEHIGGGQASNPVATKAK